MRSGLSEECNDLASGNPEQRASNARIHGFGNPHLVAHEFADGERALGLSLARTGARALSGGRTGRFQTEGLLDLAGGCGGYGSLERGRVRRVLTRRIGGGVVGSGTERLAGGGAARGDEDLVGG